MSIDKNRFDEEAEREGRALRTAKEYMPEVPGRRHGSNKPEPRPVLPPWLTVTREGERKNFRKDG